MDIDHLFSGLAVLLSLVGAGLGLRKHDSKKHQAKLEARSELGRRYAQMALTQSASVPADLQMTAALDAFRIIDTSLDGKRDFTESQARVFIDAAIKQ
ncbi:MAG: hypothetical protein IPQ23_22495 [Cytophagaceae bacterium]|nr:hypothetical protein [Cytophagaceae bacterium]